MSDDNRFLWEEGDIQIVKEGRVEDPYVSAGAIREGTVEAVPQPQIDETEV